MKDIENLPLHDFADKVFVPHRNVLLGLPISRKQIPSTM
jgi:hypothetical protein